MDKGIELRLNLRDPVEVRGDEFDGRDLPAAEFFESFGDGGIKRVGHGCGKKGNGPIRIGQGELGEIGEKPL